MYKNVDLSYILRNFGMKNFDIYKIKEKFSKKSRIVYKIKYFDSFFCLKQSYLKIEELLFVYSYLNWLNLYGFEVPYFLKSNKGYPFFKFENKFFTLTNWANGKKLDYDNTEECINSVILLAKIHNRSTNIPLIINPNFENNFINTKCKFIKYDRELDDLISFAKLVKDNFSKIFILNFNSAKYLSYIAIKYSSIINFKNLNLSGCHGDYVNKNILIRNNKVIPIDFDRACIDFSVSDLGYFLRRYLRRSNINWNFNFMDLLVKYYNEFNPISLDEYFYLISYLSFPQKFLKISKYYFKNVNYLSENQKLIHEKLLSKICISMYSQIEFSKNFQLYLKNWI